MKAITLLISTIALVQTKGVCQNKIDYEIEIISTTSVSGKQYRIQIQTSTDSTKVFTRIREAVSPNLENNLEYKSVKEQLLAKPSIDPNDQETLKLIARIKQITDAHTIFLEDMIAIPNQNNNTFVKQIENVFAIQIDSLTKKQQFTITLDGTLTEMKLIDSKGCRQVYLHQSSIQNFPEIQNLIKSTKKLIKVMTKNEKVSKYQFD
jgi:hypothetical protein